MIADIWGMGDVGLGAHAATIRTGGRRILVSGGSHSLGRMYESDVVGIWTIFHTRPTTGVDRPTIGRPHIMTQLFFRKNSSRQSGRGPARMPTGTRRSRRRTLAPCGQAGRRPPPRRRTPDPSLLGPPHVVPSYGCQDHGGQQGGDGVGGQQGGRRVRVRRYVELGRDGQHRG